MEFKEKIRAARGVLDITRDKLSEISGVSAPAIKKIESGDTQPTATTQKKLVRSLEEQGIKFTENGVEKDTSPIRLITADSPEECYLKLLKDVFETLKNKRRAELLITNADDSVSPPAINEMYRQIRNAGVKMRQLVEEGNTYLMGELEEYRYIPAQYFINRVTLIYDNKVATITDDENTISVNRDPINADTRRNLFNFMWDSLKQPEESKADERF